MLVNLVFYKRADATTSEKKSLVAGSGSKNLKLRATRACINAKEIETRQKETAQVERSHYASGRDKKLRWILSLSEVDGGGKKAL